MKKEKKRKMGVKGVCVNEGGKKQRRKGKRGERNKEWGEGKGGEKGVLQVLGSGSYVWSIFMSGGCNLVINGSWLNASENHWDILCQGNMGRGVHIFL